MKRRMDRMSRAETSMCTGSSQRLKTGFSWSFTQFSHLGLPGAHSCLTSEGDNQNTRAIYRYSKQTCARRVLRRAKVNIIRKPKWTMDRGICDQTGGRTSDQCSHRQAWADLAKQRPACTGNPWSSLSTWDVDIGDSEYPSSSSRTLGNTSWEAEPKGEDQHGDGNPKNDLSSSSGMNILTVLHLGSAWLPHRSLK